LGRDKLKNDPKSDFIAKMWRTRKVDGSWFFDPQKWKIDEKVVYSDLWKNSPHKKHCAWARTPPWEFYRIYRIFTFFCVFGPSIEPEKPSPKSASTPYPPSGGAKKWKKVKFLENNRFLMISTHGSGEFIATHFITYRFFNKRYLTNCVVIN
jgi:hypothetical protein